MRARGFAILLSAALAACALAAPVARAEFGIASLSSGFFEKGGGVDLQAGAHPYELKLRLQMNVDAEERPEGTLGQVIAQLPAGLVGDPLAVPRCPAADFEGQAANCPGNSQVGVVRVVQKGNLETIGPLYNLTPPLGVPASLGFSLASFNSFQEASLRSGSDYGITSSDITVPTQLEIKSLTETVWGVPADPSHDPERICVPTDGGGLQVHGCENEVAPAAFLSLPTACAGPLVTTVTVASVEEPGAPRSASAQTPGEGGAPEGIHGCDAPPFSPTIEAHPETSAADSPTGLHVDIHLPQSSDPAGLAGADLKDSSVTLPAGLAVNPSSADGLGACSPSQIDLHGAGPARCPADSKLGTVEIHTPLLDHPVPGQVYLAAQGENPFGSLIALYIAAHDPITGVVVKLAGKVTPDPSTGQLTATFAENPQLPFEDLEVDFDGGPRASLTTPPTCGTYTTQTTMVPWTTPEGATQHPSSPFHVTTAPAGGPCATSESQLPNAPAFEAGTQIPLAGAYSPFVLKLSRENGSQRLSALNLTLPPGLSAKLAGTAECSDAQIAGAGARSAPGQGALEKASPSCPAASEIGVVDVGAGSGAPIYVQGHAYLAGPYKGAPLSLAIITPAVAGPFDLGVVVVRAALFVDESTAQVSVKSDPIPTMLQGIPLAVRSIAVKVQRSRFMLNPTNCEAMAVSGQAISTTGAVAALSNRFQVGGCAGLGFAPKLALKFNGGTKRTEHPGLRAVLTQPEGQANIAGLSFTLPATEFVDPEHVSNPCTRPQFKEGRCPPGSVLGKVRAFSPLLGAPLEGPIYFRSNGGERELPDAVADLNGQIHLLSVGFLDSLHHKGSEESRLRTKIAVVPDAPISKVVITLNSGKQKGLLVNSQNLCKTKVPQRAIVKLTGQNGKTHNSEPLIANSCGRSGTAKHGRRAG